MKALTRYLPSRWSNPFRVRAAPPMDPLRLLVVYVLNMSMTSLGDHDVTPLYEEYIQDARLGDAEKAELTAIYRSLRRPSEMTRVAN